MAPHPAHCRPSLRSRLFRSRLRRSTAPAGYDPTVTPRTDAAEPKTLHCTEVWGGNHKVDRTVVLPGLDAWVFSEPCDHTAAGGDVHYVSACAGGQVVRMLVADVSGHGPAVAGAAEHLRRLMRRHVNDHNHRRFVRRLNRDFNAAAGGASAGLFATAVALTYDSTYDRLLACNAGHPPPLWYRADRRAWQTLEPIEAGAEGNVPWGVLDGIDFEQFAVTLGVGDLVLCYTDSLSEARDGSGELIGTPGLLDRVRSLDVADPARLVPALLAELGRLDPANLTRDDVTCLLVRPNGTRPRLPIVDRLMSPFRAVAGFAGVHSKWTGAPRQ